MGGGMRGRGREEVARINISELSSRKAVERAMDEFDRIGRERFLQKTGYGEAHGYFVERNGRWYDAKAIAGFAYGVQYLYGAIPDWRRFGSGAVTLKPVLEKLGFTVIVVPHVRNARKDKPRRWLADFERSEIAGAGVSLSDAEAEALIAQAMESLSEEPELAGRSGVGDTAGGESLSGRLFRIVVLRAYEDRCALCGSRAYVHDGTPEVEAAHIVPRRSWGIDDPRNGMALCPRDRALFEKGAFSATDDFRVVVAVRDPGAGDDPELRKLAGETLYLPRDLRTWPHRTFLAEHRKTHGLMP